MRYESNQLIYCIVVSKYFDASYLFCYSILEGYYYPDMDSLRVEPEEYTTEFLFNNSLNANGAGYIQVSAFIGINWH